MISYLGADMVEEKFDSFFQHNQRLYSQMLVHMRWWREAETLLARPELPIHQVVDALEKLGPREASMLLADVDAKRASCILMHMSARSELQAQNIMASFKDMTIKMLQLGER
jgi:hypothetical protein